MCVISVSLSLFEDIHNIVSVHGLFPACSEESTASTRFKDRDRNRKDFHLSALLDAKINSRVRIVRAALIRMHGTNIEKKKIKYPTVKWSMTSTEMNCESKFFYGLVARESMI
jgi:hypothetical protein